MAVPSSNRKQYTLRNQTNSSGNRKRSEDGTSSQQNNDVETSQPLNSGLQMGNSSITITMTPKKCSMGEAYNQILSEDGTSSQLNNDVERNQPLATDSQMDVERNQPLATDSQMILLSKHGTSSHQKNDVERNQPMNSGFQMDNSEMIITPKKCSTSEASSQLLREDGTSSHQNNDVERNQPLATDSQMEVHSQMILLRKRRGAAMHQYNDPTVGSSEQPIIHRGSKAWGKLPQDLEPISVSGGLIVRGGERKDEAEAKSDNIPDINEEQAVGAPLLAAGAPLLAPGAPLLAAGAPLLAAGAPLLAPGAPLLAAGAVNQNQVSIGDLPDDILLDILSRAAPTRTQFLLVCHSWRTLIRNRQRTLTMRESTHLTLFPLAGHQFQSLVSITVDYRISCDYHQVFTDAHLASIAYDFPGLERLEILGCDEITPAGLEYFVRQCRNIVYLHIQTCPLFDDAGVIAVVRSCRRLEEIRIAFCEVTPAGLAALEELTTATVTAVGCPVSVALATDLTLDDLF